MTTKTHTHALYIYILINDWNLTRTIIYLVFYTMPFYHHVHGSKASAMLSGTRRRRSREVQQVMWRRKRKGQRRERKGARCRYRRRERKTGGSRRSVNIRRCGVQLRLLLLVMALECRQLMVARVVCVVCRRQREAVLVEQTRQRRCRCGGGVMRMEQRRHPRRWERRRSLMRCHRRQAERRWGRSELRHWTGSGRVRRRTDDVRHCWTGTASVCLGCRWCRSVDTHCVNVAKMTICRWTTSSRWRWAADAGRVLRSTTSVNGRTRPTRHTDGDRWTDGRAIHQLVVSCIRIYLVARVVSLRRLRPRHAVDQP